MNSKGEFKLVNQNAAGIDIGATSHYVAVPEGRDSEGKDIREFGTFTIDMATLGTWLKACGITSVAMESTGVFWIPLFEYLEQQGFEVRLVDARQTKNVPGRKSDVKDCRWIQQLHSCGLLSAAFRPEDSICVLRSYLRQRATLIAQGSQDIQHMQKALTQMNLKLQHVISDITGQTGMRIIRAILNGERNAHVLAKLRESRCKNPMDVIAKALEGNYRKEHLFALKQSMDAYDMHQRQLKECDDQIEKCLKSFEDISGGQTLESVRKVKGNAPDFDLRGDLFKMIGVDLTAINGVAASTVATVIGEIGLDMTRWPTEKCFASWLGLCPGNKISGKKVLSSKTKPCSNKAASALRVAAQTLYRSQCALGAFLRQMRYRLGPAAAITATAHKIARIIYAMLTSRRPFKEQTQNEYEQRYQEQMLRKLQSNAKRLGYDLVKKVQELTIVVPA